MQNLMCLTRTSGEAVNRAGRPQSGDITTQGVIDRKSPSKSMEDYKTKEGARSRLIHVPQSANYIVESDMWTLITFWQPLKEMSFLGIKDKSIGGRNSSLTRVSPKHLHLPKCFPKQPITAQLLSATLWLRKDRCAVIGGDGLSVSINEGVQRRGKTSHRKGMRQRAQKWL